MDHQYAEADSTTNIPTPKNSPNRRLMNLSNIAICEFLEIAIHNILYMRKVYPKGAFGRRHWGNIPIWKMLHPAVSEYITKFMRVVRKLVQVAGVITVCLSIRDGRDEILEEFMFHLQQLEYEDKELCAKDILDLRTVLRELVATLCARSVGLDAKADECTFRLQTHVKRVTVSREQKERLRRDLVDKSFPWMVYNSDSEVSSQLTTEKTIESTLCKIQFFVRKPDGN